MPGIRDSFAADHMGYDDFARQGDQVKDHLIRSINFPLTPVLSLKCLLGNFRLTLAVKLSFEISLSFSWF